MNVSGSPTVGLLAISDLRFLAILTSRGTENMKNDDLISPTTTPRYS